MAGGSRADALRTVGCWSGPGTSSFFFRRGALLITDDPLVHGHDIRQQVKVLGVGAVAADDHLDLDAHAASPAALWALTTSLFRPDRARPQALRAARHRARQIIQPLELEAEAGQKVLASPCGDLFDLFRGRRPFGPALRVHCEGMQRKRALVAQARDRSVQRRQSLGEEGERRVKCSASKRDAAAFAADRVAKPSRW